MVLTGTGFRVTRACRICTEFFRGNRGVVELTRFDSGRTTLKEIRDDCCELTRTRSLCALSNISGVLTKYRHLEGS